MNRTEGTTFTRNLRGFLGHSWFSRSASAGRLGAVTKSLSADPIDPINAAFSSYADNYQSPDHLDGFHSVTRQLLANDVLDTLIQLQAEMMLFDKFMSTEPETRSNLAAQAYRRVLETYPDEVQDCLESAR